MLRPDPTELNCFYSKQVHLEPSDKILIKIAEYIARYTWILNIYLRVRANI